MKRRLGALAAIALSLSATPIGLAQAAPPDPKTMHMLEVFGSILDAIDRFYVKTPDNTALLTAAMKGMAASLDPHSDYLSPDEYARLQRPPPDRGSLGVSLVQGREGLQVASVTDGSPAANGGLQEGDMIVGVDVKRLGGLSSDEALAAMEGPIGSAVTLTVERGHGPPFAVTLVRTSLVKPAVKYELRGDVGYVRIGALEEGAATQIKMAVAAMRAQTPKSRGLVLDLRSCPGGLFDESVAVASLFLPGGNVVTQRGRDPGDVQSYNAHGEDVAHGLPLVVLINSSTAAGCEIIAAALQDRRRAQVLGLPSFGSGSVQTVIPLKGGLDGALKITTALFYRPNGAPIQKVGVTPDVVVAPTTLVADAVARGDPVFSEREALRSLDVPGVPAGPQRMVKPDAPPAGFDPKGDYQLARALALLATAP